MVLRVQLLLASLRLLYIYNIDISHPQQREPSTTRHHAKSKIEPHYTKRLML